MDVPLAVLADAANISQEGNLNILGIFNEIRAASFPAVHPGAVLVVQLRAKRSEQGENVRVVIRLMDEDRVLADVTGQFPVPEPGGKGDIKINQLFRLQGLPLERAGEYAFHILVNGDEKAVVPFSAILLTPPVESE